MKEFINEVITTISGSKRIKVVIYLFFIVGVILGSVVTSYFNTLNNQSIQHKIDKGELMRYVEPVHK